MAFVRSSAITFCACISLGFTMAANAALVDRGGGLIYDDDRDITWLSNANYGAGSVYDDGFLTTDGAMTWQSAVSWAANLSYYDSVRDFTFTDWRLPATPPPPDNGCTIPPISGGTGCTASELGHMYYGELGGTFVNPAVPSSVPGPGPFTNLQADGYWSGTEFDATFAWVLNFGFSGQQAADQKILGYYAWAVRDGDVAAIPAPGAAWLLGTGLLALIGRARRRLPSSSS